MPITVTDAEKAILQRITIPPRPEALLTVSAEAKKPEPDLQLISKAIAGDVSISAAVLQVVNSAAFRRAREIESIQQAVMTLGLKRLLPLVKSVALKSAMGESDKLKAFWQQANKIAGACSLAADAMGKPQLKDHAYMLGLFHNAGVPIMLLAFDDYGEVLSQAQTEGWQGICAIESERFGTTHTTIGALLGQRWKLPAVMVEVIYYQFDTEGLYSSGELSDLGLDLITLLKLARHAVLAQDGSEDDEWRQVEDDILSRYDLTEVDIDNLREQILDGLD